MKKLIFGCICCLAFFASCNNNKSAEEKALQARIDSLENLNKQSSGNLQEMTDLIDEVQDNFNQIKAAEKYLTVEANTQGEMNADSKTKVEQNFKMINDILRKNKESIAKLNKKMANDKGQFAALRSTIENLNKELQDRANTISELQVALAARDQEIAKLASDVKDLHTSVKELADANVAQSEKIKSQDKELNTAYYMFGTSGELKDAKIISGGFLVSSKLLKESVDKNKFIKIDIRNIKEIPVYAKKAKLLSDHPESSYSLVKDANGNQIVKITDYQKFWSLTPYLVIQVN
ncbi:MAG: hypothetical protein ACK5MK_05955 [Dysgonomonas sp.]